MWVRFLAWAQWVAQYVLVLDIGFANLEGLVVKIIPRWWLLQNPCKVVLEAFPTCSYECRCRPMVWILTVQTTQAKLWRPSPEGLGEGVWQPALPFQFFLRLILIKRPGVIDGHAVPKEAFRLSLDRSSLIAAEWVGFRLYKGISNHHLF